MQMSQESEAIRLELIKRKGHLAKKKSSSEISKVSEDDGYSEIRKSQMDLMGQVKKKKKDGGANDYIVLLSKQLKTDKNDTRGGDDGLTLNSGQMETFDNFFKKEIKRNFREVRKQINEEKQNGKKEVSEFTMERLQNMEDRVAN